MTLIELIRTYFKAKITVMGFEIGIQILIVCLLLSLFVLIKLTQDSLKNNKKN